MSNNLLSGIVNTNEIFQVKQSSSSKYTVKKILALSLFHTTGSHEEMFVELLYMVSGFAFNSIYQLLMQI